MRQQISPILASLANVFRIPLRPSVQPLVNHTCREALAQDCYRSKVLQSSRSFTSSAPLEKKGRAKADKRITLIRYFLYHPLTPRPLRFSRDRYLRHWTIHRAWNLYQAKRRAARDLELEPKVEKLSKKPANLYNAITCRIVRDVRNGIKLEVA
ncbi:hypothetical protein CIHG_02767 [Coccidioides immitis H538.4]|uniref:Uncharacterized protein n=1 Tax=Coccidioides immitis H538.4 TaxID=396776 RepID=A0A0J8RLZ9_COCIT|nr:hypothetical protein CIHG_02767 [Coccidioides immitis H538.4]